MFAWSRTEDGGGGKGGPSPFVILTGLAFGSSKTPRVTSAGLDVSSAAADKNRKSDLHPSGPPQNLYLPGPSLYAELPLRVRGTRP